MDRGDRRSKSVGNLFSGSGQNGSSQWVSVRSGSGGHSSFSQWGRASNGHSRGFPGARGVMRSFQEGTEQVNGRGSEFDLGRGSTWRRGRKSEREYRNESEREYRNERRGRGPIRECRNANEDWRRPESLPNGNKAKREWPIGFKALESELRNPPDVAILSLLSERSGYNILITQEENIRMDLMVLLFKVLAHCCKSKANSESLIALHTRTFINSFINQLSRFVMLMRREPDKAGGFFSDLADVLQSYTVCLPTFAAEKLPELLDSCEMIIDFRIFEDQQKEKDVKARFVSMKAEIEETKKKFEREKVVGRRHHFHTYEGEPPEDFRELSVIPTGYDFSKTMKPFLQRNITEGKYRDGEHYLDVQFRLLREDFVGPLRKGILAFRGGTQSKHQDVRIYRNVKITGSDIVRKELIHFIKLKLPKKFNIESSRRFMYGNLVGFTNDDFETIYFASIKERDVKFLKDGMIGVKFEDSIDVLDFSTEFVMIESKAFFIAYKHVLVALQRLKGDALPFQENLINVERQVSPPAYLSRDARYDLRAMKGMDIMKPLKGKTVNVNIPTKEKDLEDLWPHLHNILIQGGSWPPPQELGLDDSQFRAFHGALTKQLAIIQGPPGTGKTFLGLKITQVLLNNIEHWDTEYGSPILVLCYTNHALDQFLEGMLQFTQSVIRVGSQCKNPALEYYQIAKLARQLRMHKQIPVAIYQRNQVLGREVEDLEYSVKKWTTCLKNYKILEGILPLSTFTNEDIIPHYIEDQLTRKGFERALSKWLLTSAQVARGVLDTYRAVTKQEAVNSQEAQTDDEWHDAEELLAMEEEIRGIDDNEEDYLHSDFSFTVSYETKMSELKLQLDYKENLLQKHPCDWTVYERIHILNEQLQALTAGLQRDRKRDARRIERDQFLDIWELDFYGRWALYHHWVEKLIEKIKAKLQQVESEYQCKNRELKEVRDAEYLYLMRKTAVVGMTTTAAAQYALLLQELAPSIVIIEEAAEILESHVIASLTNECKHLIMIGDHQQLCPSTTVYELATKYGLNTSLFERMVKNGVSYETLAYQHRMRPSISRLLVPSIYESLHDHPSVHEYPCVQGLEKNVFFVDHQHLEREESDDNQSHENYFEANFLMALCRHLMLQGYGPKDITILTPYTGQFFLLRKLQRNHASCFDVRICVVDNFQGEESDIILLSLVRSNEEGNVGFLKTDNRVCVALSRAKHGLYIAGNMKMLCTSKSDLWRTIQKLLMDNEMIGGVLNLKCENHPDELLSVSSGEDILKKSPEGGCCRSCPAFLPRCGHSCPRVCHVTDRDHRTVRCNVACPKTLCKRDHRCPLKCWEECKPCEVPVEKCLPCGHTHTIPCHVKRKDYQCPTTVERRIPTCDHIAPMACYKDPTHFKCPRPCDTRLECGHKCRFTCHRTKDPDHEEYRCFANCEERPEGCSENHTCTKKCYEVCGKCMVFVDKVLPCGHRQKNVECHKPPEEIDCRKQCQKILHCGHKCRKMCYEECGGCMEKVKKTVPSCNHTVKIECHIEAAARHCQNKCILPLKCTHQCQARCCDPCTKECQQVVKTSKVCPRGHAISLPCYLQHSIAEEEAWAYCLEPCGKVLDCSHTCIGMCGQCLNGRLHVTCGEHCGRQLVCGHSCKETCSKVCPPCQEMCPWKCNHSKCRKKCGIPCVPCKEPCTWQCSHHRCNKKCGEACSRTPCEEICQKELPCGHKCIGFCGDPCPPQCRLCNKDDLEEFILLGNESNEDARFVLLEDCGHAIEVEALEYWLELKKDEIGVKKCPRCHHPIYNNRRYQEIIITTYRDIRAVKIKHFSMKLIIKRKEIEDILKEVERADIKVKGAYKKEVCQLRKALGLQKSNAVKKKQSFLSDGELRLLLFKAQTLKKASDLLRDLKDPERKAINHYGHVDAEKQLSSLVERAMSLEHRVTEQMEEEIDCEMHRIAVLPSVWKLQSRCSLQVQNIISSLQSLMKPTEVFREKNEIGVKMLLREAEKYVGQLGITDAERQQILKAMELKQGHWYKCPNGHIYCITECGGAMIESKCPDCGARIGGGNHALRSDNAVATEMDGASYGAWSEQNNLANFDLNLLQ